MDHEKRTLAHFDGIAGDGDDGRRRRCEPVDARRYVRVMRHKQVMDRHTVEHVAARRVDVDDNLRSVRAVLVKRLLELRGRDAIPSADGAEDIHFKLRAVGSRLDTRDRARGLFESRGRFGLDSVMDTITLRLGRFGSLGRRLARALGRQLDGIRRRGRPRAG